MKNAVIEVRGIVLRAMPLGERDRRVTLLTLEQGKIACFARGAGRPGSPLMAAARPFVYGKFSLFQGRDSFSMESAEVGNYFEELSLDVERACYGMYFLELSDYYNRELAPEPRCVELLYRSLRALQKNTIPKELVRRIFELRSMVTDGSYDADPPLKDAESCLYTWRYICTSPPGKLFSFTVAPEILKLLGENVDASLRRHVDRKMHSLDVLEKMREAGDAFP